MDKKKIIVIVISVIALILSVFVIVMSVTKEEKRNYNIPEGSVLVENTDVLKDKKIGDLLVDDVLLYTMNTKSRYTATVTNTSNKDLTTNLYITFYRNEEKTEVTALLDKTLKANDTTDINITFDIDLTKVTKIEYKLK